MLQSKYRFRRRKGLIDPDSLFQPRPSAISWGKRPRVPHLCWHWRHGAGFQLRQCLDGATIRSEEHTSELQSLMRISYAVFCLTKKNFNILKYINSIISTLSFV